MRNDDRRRAQTEDSELANLGRAAVWAAVIVLGLAATFVVMALGSMMFGRGHLM
jgi:hypothetical protein